MSKENIQVSNSINSPENLEEQNWEEKVDVLYKKIDAAHEINELQSERENLLTEQQVTRKNETTLKRSDNPDEKQLLQSEIDRLKAEGNVLNNTIKSIDQELIIDELEFEPISYFETKNGKDPMYSQENLKWFDAKDVLAIKEDILENGTKEDIVFIETLLAQKQHIQALEDEARTAFRAMLALKKPKAGEPINIERALLKEQWEEKRQAVIDFENKTQEQADLKNQNQTSQTETSVAEQIAA